MAFNFKLPFAKKSAAGEADPMQDTLVIAPAAAPATPGTTGKRGKSEAAGPVRSSRSRLPLLGALPTMQQLLILGSVLVILFGVGALPCGRISATRAMGQPMSALPASCVRFRSRLPSRCRAPCRAIRKHSRR